MRRSSAMQAAIAGLVAVAITAEPAAAFTVTYVDRDFAEPNHWYSDRDRTGVDKGRVDGDSWHGCRTEGWTQNLEFKGGGEGICDGAYTHIWPAPGNWTGHNKCQLLNTPEGPLTCQTIQ